MSVVFAVVLAATPAPGTAGAAFVRLLADGHADRAMARLDATMRAQLSAAQLDALWKSLLAAHGAFVDVERVDAESVQAFSVENVVCAFQHGRRAVRVVLDHDGQVAGLFLKPADEARARKILARFAAQDFAAVEAMLAPAAAQAGRTALARAWEQIVGAAGELVAVKRVDEEPGSLVAEVAFAKGDRRVAFAFDDKGRLLALQLLSPPQPWTPPAYVERARFEERKLEVGPHKLDGIFDVPVGAQRFPAVVLVAGSGPSDADETLGSLKPFRDLAEGLASRGVAVLRYEKRTHRGIRVRTVRDEYFEDAEAAIALLSAMPAVEKIVVVGHSLGATLAPRLALGNPKIAAVGLLAGSTWPLSKVIVEQLVYQKAQGVPNLDGLLAAARAAARQIDDPALKPDDVVPLGGATGAYFLDLRGYSAVQTAERLQVPIFIGWGDRDLKTIPADFDGWRPLAKRNNVTLRVYPNAHHLFMPVGDEHGHVVPALVEDLARWISGAGTDRGRAPR